MPRMMLRKLQRILFGQSGCSLELFNIIDLSIIVLKIHLNY